MRYRFALLFPVVAALLATAPSVQAQTLTPGTTAAQDAAAAQDAFAAAFGCSKQNAKSVALRAVGGGQIIQVVFEPQDHPPHWSVDIVGSTNEYEVWINARCKVARIITQPL